MRLLYSILVGVLSGLLLFISYCPGFTWLVFFCLVPLLIYNLHFSDSKRDVFVSSIVFLLVWNTLNLQFLYCFQSNFLNKFAPISILIYSIVGVLPFISFLVKSKLRLLLFGCCWVMIEYFFMNWQLQSPFSTLGIILGAYPKIIQWYQITGVLGGTLWILLINVILYVIFSRFYLYKTCSYLFFCVLIFLIIVPCSISFRLCNDNTLNRIVRSVRIFSYDSVIDRDRLFKNFKTNYALDCKSLSDYVLLPELVVNLDNQQPENNNKILDIIKQIRKRGGSENCILGANLTAWDKQQVVGISINKDSIQKRSKEVLVPFGEKLPYLNFTKSMGLEKAYSIMPYITPNIRHGLFSNGNDRIHVSICYESFFENHLKKYLKLSPGIVFVVAREPFRFNNHYKNISILITQIQSIVFQKPIARSSWGGVSCVVNPKGEIQHLVYDRNEVFTSEVVLNNNHTFFSETKYNFVFIASVIIFITLSLYLLVFRGHN